jgi:multidrug efflux pump subunit AcrA (membrane-fusion protein)
MLTIARIVLIILFIALGYLGFGFISGMRKPPPEIEAEEVALPVRGMLLRSEDVPVILKGYGTARARTRVSVSPEVGGLVVSIHPRLENGEIIPKGEILFQVDPRTYALRLDQAEADIARLNAEHARIEQQQKNDTRRLELSRRARDLADSEYRRVLRLLEEDSVGSRSGVELAERTLTQAEDQVVVLENALALYPLQLVETDVALKAARLARDTAALDLERTEVKAPFDARLEDVALEMNQVVTPGMPVLTVVDDSLLEIPVSLDSREASRWFPFGSGAADSGPEGWFAALPRDLAVTVAWSENPDAYAWQGRLARVERFSAETSTVIVVIEVLNGAAGGLELVEGMFCEASIPGRTARAVFRVPAEAVSHENTVILARDSRLHTCPAEVVHRHGGEAFIRGEFSDGDVLVTTRVANPLEKALLRVSLPAGGTVPE